MIVSGLDRVDHALVLAESGVVSHTAVVEIDRARLCSRVSHEACHSRDRGVAHIRLSSYS